MSLNVKTVKLGEDKEVTLRLTSKSICAYLASHGVQDAPVIVSILSAIDNLGARITLFTKALRHPEHKNTITDGEDLLDYLADQGYGRCGINGLILELSRDAGLISDEEMMRLYDAACENGDHTLDAMVKLLKGERPADNVPDADSSEQEENPT